MEVLDSATAGLDPILRESALAHVSGDLHRYLRILDMLDNALDLTPLEGINQIYWSMQRQLFLMRMDMTSVPDFVAGRLPPFYERFLRQMSIRLRLAPAARPAGRPDTGRIVIVTNQFLSDQHQPSRDLLLASPLQRDLGREALVGAEHEHAAGPLSQPLRPALRSRRRGEAVRRANDPIRSRNLSPAVLHRSRPFRFGLSLRRTDDSATRADISIPETAFVCIVVGNRLDAEVDGGFLDMLEQMLDRSPQALVLFAGGVDSLRGRLSGNRHAARLLCLGHESVLALPDISQDVIDRRIDALFVLNLFEIPRPTVEILCAYIAGFGARPSVIHICLKHPLEEIGARTAEEIRETDRWMVEKRISMWCMCQGSAEQSARLGLTRVFHEPLGLHRWIYTSPAQDGSVDLYKRWMSHDTPGLRRHPYAAMKGQSDAKDAEAAVRNRFLYLGQGWPDHIESGREPVAPAVQRDADAVSAAMMEQPRLHRLEAMDLCGLADRAAGPAWTLDFNRAFTFAFAVENRRRFAAARRNGFGEVFALWGNSWERFGIDAGPMSPLPRNAYHAAKACLDFGSLAYDTAIFPRTLEILKQDGLLVS